MEACIEALEEWSYRCVENIVYIGTDEVLPRGEESKKNESNVNVSTTGQRTALSFFVFRLLSLGVAAVDDPSTSHPILFCLMPTLCMSSLPTSVNFLWYLSLPLA